MLPNALQMRVIKLTKEICMKCFADMEEISPCHLRCPNCGMEMDCSDKGSVW